MNLWCVFLYHFLLNRVDNRVSDLDVNQILYQIELLLKDFSRLNCKVAHVLHAEIVRNVGVKHAGKISEISLGFTCQNIRNHIQVLVALHHCRLVQLAERQSLRIVANLDNTLLYELHVKYQGDK